MSKDLYRDYQICEEIGRGRFGVVFRCVSLISGHSYAVKSIDKSLLSDDSIDRQCLDLEVKLNRRLTGIPNVVSIFQSYEDQSHLHMIFEICESPDLYRKISQLQGPVTESEAISIMYPLMHAIAECHRRGVAHRDIKPDNVLFDRHNRLKLADFGSAEFFRQGELMEGIVGTPYYVAPEVLDGKSYNEKVDVWSVGVILYVMLSGGIPPFYGDSVQEIFESVLSKSLRFPYRLFHSVSPSAKDLLRRMLSRDVMKRFSAEQVLRHPWMTTGKT